VRFTTKLRGQFGVGVGTLTFPYLINNWDNFSEFYKVYYNNLRIFQTFKKSNCCGSTRKLFCHETKKRKKLKIEGVR
jgi:hypothetical protein